MRLETQIHERGERTAIPACPGFLYPDHPVIIPSGWGLEPDQGIRILLVECHTGLPSVLMTALAPTTKIRAVKLPGFSMSSMSSLVPLKLLPFEYITFSYPIIESHVQGSNP